MGKESIVKGRRMFERVIKKDKGMDGKGEERRSIEKKRGRRTGGEGKESKVREKKDGCWNGQRRRTRERSARGKKG